MKRAVLILFLSFLHLTAEAVCLNNEPWMLWNYTGVLGDRHQARMTLVFAGEEVSGVYFYVSQLKDIALRGKVTNGSDIRLDELDGAGRTVARFEGKFAERDPRGRFGNSPLECEVIVGTWHKLDSTEHLTVYFSLDSGTVSTLSNRYSPAGADDDQLIHRRAERFRDAVRRGDKKAVAAAIAYPITVGLPGGKKRFGNAAALIGSYDAIFSEGFRAAITQAVPHNMFVRDQGIMLGSGEVWFGPDGKVVALNP